MTTRRRRSTFREVEHAAYLIDRTALDVNAARRGRLGRRLLRRSLERSFFRSLGNISRRS